MNSYNFSNDWFSNSKYLFEKHLVEFVDKPVQFLEIGNYEGRSAFWQLDHILNNPLANLTCVDPQLDSVVRKRFNENSYLCERATNQLTVYYVKSLDYFLKYNDGSRFDFIYVDGSHTQEDVLLDAVLAFNCLNQHGIMCFDDYGRRDPNDNTVGPREAIDGFLESYKRRFILLEKDYQVWLKKL